MAFSLLVFWGKSRLKHPCGINTLKILEISSFNELALISVLRPNKSLQKGHEDIMNQDELAGLLAKHLSGKMETLISW